MAVEERDPHTGYATTGHEWNGIKELNTPVPRAVFFFLGIAILFAVGYWILMPAWPVGGSYTKGVLHADQKASVDAVLKQASVGKDVWSRRIVSLQIKQIESDPALMQRVRETGHALFGDNCAACHGNDARGGPGFPNLTTASWLWGGDPEAMAQTIRVGINATHPDTRVSQMPAFGSNNLLKPSEVDNVVSYVLALSNPALSKSLSRFVLENGKAVFLANCASCHGAGATGDMKAGVPNLADKVWIYGGDRETIATTVWAGRQGFMPSWETRLSPVDRKILLLYLRDERTRP